MQRILICLMALLFSTAVSAQFGKKSKKKKTETEQTDSTAVKKENAEDGDKNNNQQDTAKKTVVTKKKDYKKLNEESKKKVTGQTGTGTTGKNGKTPTSKKPLPKPKPKTLAEKKQAEKEEAERIANTPKGVEAYFYEMPKEDLPVVEEFMAVKQEQSPHLVVKDDIILRKQIIRYKNIDKGYLMLQKPGDSKYTRLQAFKKSNGNILMAVEQSDCNNGFCVGTLKFYLKSAGGWKEVTEEFFPQIDTKYVISTLKAKYKKVYKDLELYNEKAYEDNEANLKKAITFTIAPDEGKILIQEQYLPCSLYELIWDGKKDKFDLKKADK